MRGLKEIMIVATVVAAAAVLNACVKQYEAENAATGAQVQGNNR